MFKIATLTLVLSAVLSISAFANPMRPDNYNAPRQTTNTVVKKPRAVSFTLSDIAITGDLRFAYINSQALTLNDQISGYRITRIEPEFVVLTKGSTQRTLYLKTPGSFKIVPSTEDSPSE